MNYLGATLTWKNGRSLASYSKETNNYNNLIVLPSSVHKLFTAWWASY